MTKNPSIPLTLSENFLRWRVLRSRFLMISRGLEELHNIFKLRYCKLTNKIFSSDFSSTEILYDRLWINKLKNEKKNYFILQTSKTTHFNPF